MPAYFGKQYHSAVAKPLSRNDANDPKRLAGLQNTIQGHWMHYPWEACGALAGPKQWKFQKLKESNRAQKSEKCASRQPFTEPKHSCALLPAALYCTIGATRQTWLRPHAEDLNDQSVEVLQ